MKQTIITRIRRAPVQPGVYIFSAGALPLYIGKASNLRQRLRWYLAAVDLKSRVIDQQATRLRCLPCLSPIAALIEESRLIKTLQPSLNVAWKDDKNYFYAAFTSEPFPKIFVTHQPKFKIRNSKFEINHIGPFTDGRLLRLALKTIRRRFLYCSCLQSHRRVCLNTQIGNCPGYCCTIKINVTSSQDVNTVLKRSYLKNIRIIKNILWGKNKKFIKSITPTAAMMAMENIYDHAPFINQSPIKIFSSANAKRTGAGSQRGSRSERAWFERSERASDESPVSEHAGRANDSENQPPPSLALSFSRIECYDISHFSGKEAVGAMTVLVFQDGRWQADRASFRRFKIRAEATRDDPRMIAEILSRRLNHPEWPSPDLIIIDGGLAQYRAAESVLNNFSAAIAASPPLLFSFAKPEKKIYGPSGKPIDRLPLDRAVFEQAIAQTHRYVLKYHRDLRTRQFML